MARGITWTFKNQVREWRKIRRSRYDWHHEMYGKLWDQLKTKFPEYKSALRPGAAIFANNRDGYTRGSHMCTERRANVLAHRARGAVAWR